MTLKFKTAIVCVTLLAGTTVFAQTKAPEPDYTLGFNIGVTTDYRFRGIAQTTFDPAIQGGVDYAHKSGFYLGAWASNVSWLKDYIGAKDGSLELDIYGGFKGEISKDLTFDVGLITYQYPSNSTDKVTGFVNANTTEIYGALTYGPVTAKYSRAVSNFIANANSSGSGYFELAACIDLGNGLMLTPHIGRQSVANQAADAGDYTDYSLTLAKDFGNGMVVSIAAVGTNANKVFYSDAKGNDFLGKNALTVGLKYSF